MLQRCYLYIIHVVYFRQEAQLSQRYRAMLPLRIIGYLGRLKMQDWKMTDQMSGWKMQDWKMTDKIAGVKNAKLKNADQIAGVENAGLRNDGPILEVVLCF